MTTYSSAGKIGGKLKFTFNGEYVFLPAHSSDLTSKVCKSYLEELPNIGTVKCSRNKPDARGGATWDIQLLKFPVVPYENNLFYHNGTPPLSSFNCDTSLITSGTSVTCTLADVNATQTPGTVGIPKYFIRLYTHLLVYFL